MPVPVGRRAIGVVALKGVGVRTGRIAAYMPGLLKPAQSGMCLRLRALAEGAPVLPPPGAASFRTERGWSRPMLEAAGYIRLGPRAVRADMAERLSWQIGQLRKSSENSAFAIPPDHAALVGAPLDDFVEIVKAIGLIPAERDKESGAVTLWRFSAKKTQEKKQAVQTARAVEDSPFAALAALVSTEPERDKPKKKPRRRKKKPGATTEAAQSSDVAAAGTGADGAAPGATETSVEPDAASIAEAAPDSSST